MSAAVAIEGERLTVHDGHRNAPLDLQTVLTKVEVVGEREGGLIDCYVPVEFIDFEEVPVKEEWAASLATNMKERAKKDGGTGQLTPVILGLIEGEDTLKIIDGFHRDAALRHNGVTHIYATVKVTDWDELFDTRILTAKDHTHVRFSRVVQWIREIWDHNPLSEKISVEQAVLLYRYDLPGRKLDLAPEEAEAAKDWVERKEHQWQMAAMTIHSHLKVAEHVDPVLVHSTREKISSDELVAPTQAILKIFSTEIPGNFELQNLVMGVAMERNLTGTYVRALCKKIQSYSDTEEASQAIESINWDTWEPEFGDTKRKALRRAHDPRNRGEKVLEKTLHELGQVVVRMSLTHERGEPVTEEMKREVVAAQRAVNRAKGLLEEVEIGLAGLLTIETTVQTDAEPRSIPEPTPAPVVELVKATLPEAIPQPPTTELAEPKSIRKRTEGVKTVRVIEPVTKPRTPKPTPSTKRARKPTPTIPEAEAASSTPSQPIISSIESTPVSKIENDSENPLVVAFKKNVKSFLSGKTTTPPKVRTRLDVVRAKEILEESTTRGARVMELEDLIAEAEEHFARH